MKNKYKYTKNKLLQVLVRYVQLFLTHAPTNFSIVAATCEMTRMPLHTQGVRCLEKKRVENKGKDRNTTDLCGSLGY